MLDCSKEGLSNQGIYAAVAAEELVVVWSKEKQGPAMTSTRYCMKYPIRLSASLQTQMSPLCMLCRQCRHTSATNIRTDHEILIAVWLLHPTGLSEDAFAIILNKGKSTSDNGSAPESWGTCSYVLGIPQTSHEKFLTTRTVHGEHLLRFFRDA